MKQYLKHGCLLTAMGLLYNPVAQATSFNITAPSTTAQTLTAGQTGVVSSSGSLTLGGTNIPITVTGSSTITNSGQIIQTGTGRGILNAAGTVTLGITNNVGALIRTADADTLRITPTTSSATLDNFGSIISLNASKAGSQAVDWSNITSGSNILNNYSTGLIQSFDADAVRLGVNGVLVNSGTIKSTVTTDTGSDGIDMQNNTGAVITNNAAGLIEGARHGITGGALNNTVTFTTSVTNNLGGTIQGDNGSGINLDGFNANQTATIINGGTISGNGITGDGDGIDVDGLVNITNTGTIRSINAFNLPAAGLAFSEGVTVGGGTITNSGIIEGLVAAGNTNAVGRGITLAGNDITTGPLIGTREAIYGNATVTNQAGGLIKGQSDSAIVVEGSASGFTVTINNNAGGIIQGGGTRAAAIRTGADNDAIVNAGTINGSSSGKAIDMGAGNNTLTVQGGAASIQGDVSGGIGGSNTLNLNIGVGNNFAYFGSLSNFNNVQVNGGTTILSGASNYTGPTTVNSGYLLANNSAGSATGAGAVDVMSGGGFGGIGAISSPLTVETGATLSPGIGGVGTLNVGDTLLKANSTFAIDLDPTNSQGHGIADKVNVTGSVSLDLSDLVISLLYAPIVGQSFDILTNDGNDLIAGHFNQGNTVSVTFGGQSWNFNVDYAYNADGGLVGNDIRLTALAPVPLPAAVWLFGSVLTSLVCMRRRKA